jgi:hypothetical protein
MRPPSFLQTPAASRAVAQRWFILALLLLFVGLSVQYSYKVGKDKSAFRRWQPQLLGLENGENLAQTYQYPNPPVMALLLYPLAKLPPVAAALLWFYIKVGMTLLALHWVFRLVETEDRPFPPWARALVVLLSLRPIIGDLQHGNVNLLILFLVVASLTAYRRRRDGLAGVVLGLAVACKVTPALFVPYFVWKRAWRVLAACAAGLALFLWPGLVPSLCLGFEDNQRQLKSWYDEMVYPFVVEGKITSEHNNQSLPGLVARLATHSPSWVIYPDNVWTPKEYHNLLDLDPAHARWLIKGCMGAFALAVVWCCRTATNSRRGWRLSAEFALVLLGMLLFSERTWKHHCVTLLLPFAVLCYHLAVCKPGPRLRAYLIGSLATAALLMATTSTGLLDAINHSYWLVSEWLLMATTSTGLVDEAFAKEAQVYGAYVLAYLVLAAALVTILRTRETTPAAASSVPLAA